MKVIVLQQTDASFLQVKGKPKIYATIADMFQAGQSKLRDAIAANREEDHVDIMMFVAGKGFRVNDTLSNEVIERIVKHGQVKVVIHLNTKVECYILTNAKVKG